MTSPTAPDLIALGVGVALLLAVLGYLAAALPRLNAASAVFTTAALALLLMFLAAVAGTPLALALVTAAAALAMGHAGHALGRRQAAPKAPRRAAPSAAGSPPAVAPKTPPVAQAAASPAARPADTPVPGRSLGRYTIDRELGRGAMGAVYLGRDPKIGRQVAIKTMALTQEFEGDALTEARQRFFREAETAGRLQHRDIVTIFDAGEDQGLAYIAMEFLRGDDLQRHTQPGALLAPALVVGIAARVAEALAYAHSQGVVHRDIKPANVMLDRVNGGLKLMDFGIARVGDGSRTRTGLVLGTPSFMSPEHMSGLRVDGRSDLYSLGVMVFQLLTGRLPHRADSMAMLMHQIANAPAPDLRTLRPELPEALALVVAKSLEKSPTQRHVDGRQMAEALAATIPLLAGRGTAAAPTPGTGPAAAPDSDGFAATVKWNRDDPGHNSRL
jgi:eukaryotic-like serine/threonine-protein kinase